mgnify:CR=1 FL=1
MNDLNYKESSYNFEFPYEDDESKRILYKFTYKCPCAN